MKKLLLITALVGSMGLLAACADESADTPKTEAKPAAEKKAEAPKKAATAQKMRAQFTTAVEEREPVDKLDKVTKEDEGRIVFFSEIVGQADSKVYHVWKNGDEDVYKHSFNIGSDKWRVYSNVSQWHYAGGDIALVEIQDEDGNVLDSYSIEVVE